MKPIVYEVPIKEPGKICICGKQIWFVKTKNGKMMPVERDGETHFGRCSEEHRFRFRGL